MLPSRFAVLLFVVSILIPAAKATAQDATSEQFGEVIEVRVINVDVVVTDRHGNPVRGLKREDFELFENGKQVDIGYFSRISEGFLEFEPTPTEPAPSGAEPKIARDPVTWAFFIDQLNLPPKRRNEALRQLRTFLEQTVVDRRDQGLVASLDQTSFRLRQELTDDRSLLLDALARLEKERAHPGPSVMQAAMIRNEITRTDPADREYLFVAQNIGNAISLIIEEEVERTRNATRAMGALLDVLARVEGRVVLVYVGAGFNTLPGIALAELWRARFPEIANSFTAPRPEQRQAALEYDVQQLFSRLSAMRIALYTIHGTDGRVLPDAADPGLGQTQGGDLGERGALTEAGLAREMAERTGGLAFKVSPQLADQMRTVRNDLSDYYSLGYSPTGEAGRPRTIKVRVKVDGARLRHRIDVREKTSQDEPARVAIADLPEPPKHVVAAPVEPRSPVLGKTDSRNPLGVSIEPGRPLRDKVGRHYVLPFSFKIRLETLTFAPAGNGFHANLLLHFALVAPDGTVWPLESREQTLRVARTELPTTPGPDVAYAWHLDLAPLRVSPRFPITEDGMRLSVSVLDRATQLRSIVTVPLS